MKILDVKNLTFKYKSGKTNLFNDISFEASEGELILLCGATACGKTTLLKCLKPELSPYGVKSGEINFCDTPLTDVEKSVSAAQIGYVMQRPENQTVTDKVRSELAFCGENLGLKKNIIHRQIAETAAYFGLEAILDEKTSTLSGGQRQLLNLASVMAVNPKLILLDEPTSQLDPIAAGDFIRTLYRITRELSITVIIIEHRFEELLPLADKVLLLENGRQAVFDTPHNAAKILSKCSSILPSLPSGLQLYSHFSLSNKVNPPITISESRNMLKSQFNQNVINADLKSRAISNETAIKLKNVFFTYQKNKNDIIRNTSLTINKGEVFSILGSNGSGKSTLLSVISGILSPYNGSVEINDKPLKKYKKNELYHELLALLPQDVQSSFLTDTVGQELDFTSNTAICDMSSFFDMHPYDLSGGQQQLLGIKKMLMNNPKIVLLDEPTKGLDGNWKDIISKVILEMRDNGITILIVTHDMELAARCSDRCGIFFDGSISCIGTPSEIFNESIFYTTDSAKTSHGIYNGICTTEQLIELCRINGLSGDVK